MYPAIFSYIECRPDGDDINVSVVGGQVKRFTAAGALNVGDAVFFSAANTVNKSTSAANYAGYAGIVVGGTATGMRIPTTTDVASVAAASGSGDTVLVQTDGIANVVAGGTVTPGTHYCVVPDTGTAGRVVAGTTANQILGTTVTAGAAAGFMKILIRHR